MYTNMLLKRKHIIGITGSYDILKLGNLGYMPDISNSEFCKSAVHDSKLWPAFLSELANYHTTVITLPLLSFNKINQN